MRLFDGKIITRRNFAFTVVARADGDMPIAEPWADKERNKLPLHDISKFATASLSRGSDTGPSSDATLVGDYDGHSDGYADEDDCLSYGHTGNECGVENRRTRSRSFLSDTRGPGGLGRVRMSLRTLLGKNG